MNNFVVMKISQELLPKRVLNENCPVKVPLLYFEFDLNNHERCWNSINFQYKLNSQMFKSSVILIIWIVVVAWKIPSLSDARLDTDKKTLFPYPLYYK